MRWLSSFGSKSGGVLCASPRSQSKTHSSLALRALLSQLEEEQKYTILDLGAADGANVDFFSQICCTLYIENLYQTVTSLRLQGPDDGFQYEELFRQLLPFKKLFQFDIVLAWDLLNYLSRLEFQYLMQHLDRYCRSGTLLFALVSTRKEIPERPMHFKILGVDQVIYESEPVALRPAPRFKESELEVLMPKFHAYKCFLLRNGMKEYLFIRE